MTPQLERLRERSFNEALDDLLLVQSPIMTMARADAERYVRERDLPKILPLFPGQLADYSIQGTRNILEKLAGRYLAARDAAERGHWSADLNQQIAYLGALIAEKKFLGSLVAVENASLSANLFRGAA